MSVTVLTITDSLVCRWWRCKALFCDGLLLLHQLQLVRVRERAVFSVQLGTWRIEVMCESASAVLCSGVRHSCRAVQRDSVGSPAGREHGRDVLYWQRGTVRHLLPHAQTHDTNIRRPQPPRLSHHVRHYNVPQVSRPGPPLPHSFRVPFSSEVWFMLLASNFEWHFHFFLFSFSCSFSWTVVLTIVLTV